MGKGAADRPSGYAVLKGEDPLVQVVGDHKEEQHGGDDGQQPRPSGQAVFLRLSQQQGNIHPQQREKQHRQIVEIPHIPRRRHAGHHMVFQRPQNKPQEHQQRRQAQAVQHLLLYDASVNGKAPPREKQQVQRGTDIVGIHAADIEFAQYPAGVGHGDDRENENHRQQLSGIPLQAAPSSLSLCTSGCGHPVRAV